jgi:hypothetical protein
MYAQAGDVADFTGVLVRRQYKKGEKYVHLFFQTTEGVRLSVTRNLHLVGSLSEGHTYRVSGQEYILGQKKLVHEPTATLINSKSWFRNRLLIIVPILVLLIGGTTSALLLKKNDPPANSGQTGSKSLPAQTTQPTEMPPTTTQEPGPTAQNQPAATPQTGTSTSTKKTSTTNSNPAVATPSPSPAPQPAPPPAPESPPPEPTPEPPPVDPPVDPPADPGI